MPVSKVVSMLEEWLEPELEKIQVELVDLEYRRENHEQILRVFIDSPAGVDLELCAKCTRIIKSVIDNRDDIIYDHIEVSSPGLNRVIKKEKDLARFQGQRVKVRTSEALNDCKNFTGILKDFNSEYLNIEVDEQAISLPRTSVTLVRLYPEF
ncbi:MAG TPA: ribosome maturation factor RimP [Syntrophomonadaceae bacterium]|nr:ribosome maturation factor RimP [Syntrophomonadaceae bacterium]